MTIFFYFEKTKSKQGLFSIFKVFVIIYNKNLFHLDFYSQKKVFVVGGHYHTT